MGDKKNEVFFGFGGSLWVSQRNFLKDLLRESLGGLLKRLSKRFSKKLPKRFLKRFSKGLPTRLSKKKEGFSEDSLRTSQGTI